MSKKNTLIDRIAFIVLGVPVAIVILGVITPIAIFTLPFYYIYGQALFLLWHHKHGKDGKVFLAVYSDSHKWKEYFPDKILPVLEDKAVIVNISADPTWKAARSIERLAHRHWGGRQEHTPIILFLPRRGRVQEVRFYEAFLAYAKRGDESELLAQIEKLKSLVAP